MGHSVRLPSLCGGCGPAVHRGTGRRGPRWVHWHWSLILIASRASIRDCTILTHAKQQDAKTSYCNITHRRNIERMVLQSWCVTRNGSGWKELVVSLPLPLLRLLLWSFVVAVVAVVVVVVVVRDCPVFFSFSSSSVVFVIARMRSFWPLTLFYVTENRHLLPCKRDRLLLFVLWFV